MTGAPILLLLLAWFAVWTVHAITSGLTHAQAALRSGGVPGERGG